MTDQAWAQKQLAKRAEGERFVHGAPCKDGEGEKGWLVVSDQRIWYFQEGFIAASEEYPFGCEMRLQKIPFASKKVMLVIEGQPFTMPTDAAEEFVRIAARLRRS